MLPKGQEVEGQGGEKVSSYFKGTEAEFASERSIGKGCGVQLVSAHFKGTGPRFASERSIDKGVRG